MEKYYVYILASRRNGTLYTGSTGDLIQRVYAHKQGIIGGFTRRYTINLLVYFEECDSYEGALQREKQIKEWKRKWKPELIEKSNPRWEDLYNHIL